jgi:glycosyltransferase involved in cell wall biosynthesis
MAVGMSAAPRLLPPLLLHVYPSFAVGGAQVRFAAIANHFGRRWRHAIVALDGNLACRERLDPGLDLSFPQIALPKGDTLGNIRRIRAMLAALAPQTLVTSNWGSIEWGMANALHRGRQLHVEDGFGPEERHTQLRRRVWTRRLVLRRTQVAVPSRVLWRIATEVWRLDPKRVAHVPNGIDLAAFAARGTTATGEVPVIGTVAALRAEKNIGRLIRAVALLRAECPARLVIVGDGPERGALEQLAATLGMSDTVRFAGHLARPQGEYAGFDIFALSSDTEQMPLSVLEAMAAGLPVATTDVGDIRFMLAPENFPHIAAPDDAALAAALRSLLVQPALRAMVGAANRARVAEKFDQLQMFAAYAALFDGLAVPTESMASGGIIAP